MQQDSEWDPSIENDGADDVADADITLERIAQKGHWQQAIVIRIAFRLII